MLQAEASHLELHLGLPGELQGAKLLGHFTLFVLVNLSGAELETVSMLIWDAIIVGLAAPQCWLLYLFLRYRISVALPVSDLNLWIMQGRNNQLLGAFI